MKVGVLCECSGVVRDAFLALGHDAVSCDLKPTRRPGPHRQGDVWTFDWTGFDLLICHPDCTYLTCSAEWAYGDGPYHQKVKPGTLVGAASKATCLWLKGLPKLLPTKMAYPRMVCPCGHVYPYTQQWGCSDCGRGHKDAKQRWSNQTNSGQNIESPTKDPEVRREKRSVTYPGIAEALAAQWGAAVLGKSDSLVAYAPLMLEACREVLMALEMTTPVDEVTRGAIAGSVNVLRDAIAKATGA